MRPRLNKFQTVVLFLTFVGLLAAWLHDISGSRITGDPEFSLIAAVNLQHHGSFSRDEAEPRTPTMYREPIPVFVTAAAIGAVDAALGRADLQAYFSGERARLLKLQNLIWLTLLCGAAFLITFRLTSSFGLSVGMGVLSYAVFLYPGWSNTGVDSLGTEIMGTAILLPASWYYAQAVAHRKMKALAAAGVLFGMLALIKAVALYVFAGLVIALVVFRLLRRSASTVRSTALEVGMLTLTFAVVIAPWMYRNWVHFDTFAISQRGGINLYHRALFNDVNAVEYRGLFYIWAPSPIRGAVGRILGFSPQDLERGGSLSRLNARVLSPENIAAKEARRPEDATSLMAEGLAELSKARAEFAAQGLDAQRAALAADNFLKDRALEMMRDNPGGALAVTVAALWRGAFLLLPLFAYVMVDSWRKRRDDLIAFCLPAFGAMAFYALFSHFEPRYGSTMTPIALLAAAVVMFNSSLGARLRTGLSSDRWLPKPSGGSTAGH